MRKRECPNLVRMSMLPSNQSRYAMYQNACLTSSGPSQHQHRSMSVIGGLLLLRIELRICDSHGAHEHQHALCERKANKATRISCGCECKCGRQAVSA